MLKIKVKNEDTLVTAEEVKGYKEKAFEKLEDVLQTVNMPKLQEFARHMWNHAPDYFFVIPASVSGKHHAEWSTGMGGLIRHVMMGAKVAQDLARTFGLTAEEKDLAVVAMLGHDILKYGFDFNKQYMPMHPFLPRVHYGSEKSPAFVGMFAYSEEFETIMRAIERHMGSIATGEWTSVAGVKPETPLEQVVHLADYVASRKDLVHTDYVGTFSY